MARCVAKSMQIRLVRREACVSALQGPAMALPHSVRRSLAIWGVIVMLPLEIGVDTGGGRRKDKYQYMVRQ